MWDFPLFPERASTAAAGVDLIYFVLVGLSIIFAALVFSFIIFLAVRYRASANVDRSNPISHSNRLEFLWSFIPLVLGLAIFGWSAHAYFNLYRAPADAMEIYVVGKQWMWKIQHPEGKQEIDELHVPIGQPVKLIMTSEDVIHSFYVPAFRIKQDVLPGRYTSIWFQATETGRFHLFCAEYCGANHSRMIGSIVVMEPVDFEKWLSTGNTGAPPTAGGAGGDAPAGGSMATAGQKQFEQLGCITCHNPKGGGVGPSLVGVFGSNVQLQGGQTVTADEEYLRESILEPQAKVVAGYSPVMPTYQGQIGQEQLQQLIAYLKSLGTNQGNK
jgi:cytochrome c oxidase subunit 2